MVWQRQPAADVGLLSEDRSCLTLNLRLSTLNPFEPGQEHSCHTLPGQENVADLARYPSEQVVSRTNPDDEASGPRSTRLRKNFRDSG